MSLFVFVEEDKKYTDQATDCGCNLSLQLRAYSKSERAHDRHNTGDAGWLFNIVKNGGKHDMLLLLSEKQLFFSRPALG